MPMYEYQCRECGYIMEVLVLSAKEKQKLFCSECKSEYVNRLISKTYLKKGGSSEPAYGPRCGSETTCCGSTTPCDTPGCES